MNPVTSSHLTDPPNKIKFAVGRTMTGSVNATERWAWRKRVMVPAVVILILFGVWLVFRPEGSENQTHPQVGSKQSPTTTVELIESQRPDLDPDNGATESHKHDSLQASKEGGPKARAIPHIHTAESIAELILSLKGASRIKRQSALTHLIEHREDALKQFEKILLEDDDSHLLMLALSFVREARARHLEEAVLAAIDDKEKKVQVRAVLTLGQIGRERALDAIRKKIRRTEDEAVLKSCLVSLARLGDKGDLRVIEAHLEHEDENVRVNAAIAAARLGSDAGANLLVESSRSKNPLAAKESIYGLGFIHSLEALSRIEEIVQDDKARWRSYAKIAQSQQLLSSMADGDRLRLLKTLASDSDQVVADWAIERLTDQQPEVSVKALTELSESQTPAASRAARKLRLRFGQTKLLSEHR